MKDFVFVLIIVLQCFKGYGQQFVGTWKGDLQVGTIELDFVLHIEQIAGGFTVQSDSPDQGAYGLPGQIEVVGDSLSISLDMGAHVRGRLKSDTTISSVFYQGDAALPLLLRKQNERERLMSSRPQEPQPPYPYDIEDFECVRDSETTFAGTISAPKEAGSYPGVILISGSGQQNRDSELYGHKPFKVLADYLTRNGFVVLRFDDLGVGKSKGDVSSLTTLSQAEDISSLVMYLAQHPKVNMDRIGLIGHSEGGVIAPIVAAKNSQVRYIISLAGMAIPGYELLNRQRRDINGHISSEKDKFYSDIILAMRAEGSLDEIRTGMTKVIDSYDGSDPLNAQDTTVLSRMFLPWYITFGNLDPAYYLRQLDIPVMAVNGGKDVQVIAKDNLHAFAQYIPENEKHLIKEYPRLNHLFQVAERGALDEYGEIEETLNEEVLKDIVAWLQTLFP